MFCANCGTKLEDGVIVCPNCGTENALNAAQTAAQDTEQSSVQNASQDTSQNPWQSNWQNKGNVGQSENTGNSPYTMPDYNPNWNANAPQKSKMDVGATIKKITGNKKLFGGIIGAVVALIAIIVIIAVVAGQPEKINLEEYIEITCRGYDGYGTAYVSLDETALYEKLYEVTGQKKDFSDIDSLEAFGSALSGGLQLVQVVDTIELEITSDRENLSNGDIVTVSITYDNKVAKDLKIKFTGSEASLKVEGLEEVEEIDPFEDLEVSFSGIAPDGRVDYIYNGNNGHISTYSFDVDKWDGLRNGDVVTISIDADDEYTLYSGYVITKKEEQYTVSGLEEYVESYSDLTEEFLTEVKSEAEDTIYSYTASSYDSSSSLSDLTYAGYIINSVKDASGYVRSYNNLYVIFKGTVSSSEGDFRTSTVYFPVRYKNILKGDNGLSYESNEGILGNSYLDGSWWNSTKGYINPYTCYIEIVEENRDDYNAESGDGFEAYAEYKNIEGLGDISEAYKQELNAEVEDIIESYIASKYSDDVNVSGLAFAGEYLLMSKTQGTDFGNNNKYYVVYSATVSSSEDRFETTTVYYPVEYDGVVSLPRDEFMVTAAKGIQGSSSLPGSWWYSTNGYVDGAEMYSKIVTANRDNYTYEVSEGLKQFGE